VLKRGRLRVVPQLSHDDLYNAQRPRVERLCRLLLADSQEAQDVAQEVLMKVYRALQARRPEATSERWVTRVTVNACRDRRRLAWWRRWRSGGAEFREEELTARGATPEEALLTREARGHLWAEFRRLSPRQQEVFTLRHVEGFSTAEVAETLRLSAGSAKRHLFRAVHRLRRALQESP
jgi:RNA polymerase sigma factor (sigma-70 family)